MKTHWKISIVCFQLLLVLGCSLGTQATVKTDQFDEGTAAYQAGNYQKALELFKPFAEQGDAKAQYNLGIMYGYGRGVPQNNKEAVKWYRKAAEQGYVLAQYNLGIMYGYGRGVPQNNKEAVKWYRKAAEQGLAIAQSNLGIMYENGHGVPRDYTEAIKWYRKAAEQGLAIAQYNLGIMYGFGKGVPQDYVLAYKWFSLSVPRFQGKYHEEAVRKRDLAEKGMTPAQVAEAQKLAREWRPKTWKELSRQN